MITPKLMFSYNVSCYHQESATEKISQNEIQLKQSPNPNSDCKTKEFIDKRLKFKPFDAL